MKFYLVLYLLTREVAAVIQSVAWKEVFVHQTLVSFTVTLPVSAIKAGNICDATDKCVLVCAVEGGYGLSENKFESEYYEKGASLTYKCWTKMTMKYTPLKLNQDGLYYHADRTRTYTLRGYHCILACRRIPGYRSVIARTDDQLSAIAQEYSGKLFFTGLVKHQEDGTEILKWVDGTDFTLTTYVHKQSAIDKYFILYNDNNRKLDDYGGEGSCLCQGNPSLLDW